MAEKSGFFNSVNGDRKYKADFFAEYFASFIGNGIFPNPSTSLQAISNSNMTVTINSGKAWINGYYYFNDSNLVLTIDTADGVLNRIDKIVLQFDTLNRTINLKVKKGSFATNPTAPVLQRDANAYELGLADIYVGKGALSITQSNITDLRLDTTKCGIVHGTVEQLDTTTLFNQYQTWIAEKKSQYNAEITNWTAQKQSEYEAWFDATTAAEQSEFDIWFDGIKGIFEGDAIGNLTNKVNSIPVFQTAQGTANAIVLTDFDLIDGNSKNFIVAYNNSGAATSINGKNLYKPNTTNSPTLTAGKAVTVWYSTANDCFFIKASAEGNTIAAHVLAGDIFSNDVDTGLVGTMQNNGAITITPAATAKMIPQGYHNGLGTVATDSNLISANIKSGKTIFGVSGKSSVVETSDGTAIAEQMLSGSTAYINGAKITGNIVSKSATNYTPSTSNQIISAGQYLSGIQTILGDSNLIASNIVSGKSIFGIAGNVTIQSLGGKAYSSGVLYSDYNSSGSWYTSVTLPFTPAFVVARYNNTNYAYIAINAPSIVGLTKAVEWNSVPTLDSSSSSATVTAVNPATYPNYPGIKIVGNVITFGYQSSNHYYNWIAYGN